MYSHRIELAIQAATLLHQDHVRQGSVQIPYISHLMSVVLILRDYTSDENTLVSAILHDTLEDSDYTENELREDFGDEVADIVRTLTEPTYVQDRKLPWLETKKRYAAQIKNGPEAALLIAAADKSHNFRSIVDEYNEDHVRFIQDFGKHFDARLEAYQHIANAINSRLKDGIVHEFNHTFEHYKTFISDVKNSQEN